LQDETDPIKRRPRLSGRNLSGFSLPVCTMNTPSPCVDIVQPEGCPCPRRGHRKSASCSMSPSLQRYLAEMAALQEQEIELTDQKFKSHVGLYRLVKSIGQGSGGEVFLGRHAHTSEKVAIKIVRKNSKKPHWERMARQENSIMQYLNRFQGKRKGNKHIVQHIMALENEKEIGIVMEYAQGGDLFELVKRRGKLHEFEAWRIFRQLILAVKFIHGKRICHRDIQPCNIFLDKDRNVLLGDWGHSKTWTPFDTTQENCGSLCYAAPEVCLADKTYVGPEIDLWSCGTVLYVMLSGQRPFWSKNTSNIYQNIQAGKYKKLPDNLSPEVHHLLSILLSTDPLKRATMLDVLNHPWMKNHPARARRSESSPFLVCPGSYSPNPKRQPHPLLIARRAKGISCEQLDLGTLREKHSLLILTRAKQAMLANDSEPNGDFGDEEWKDEGKEDETEEELMSPPDDPAAETKLHSPFHQWIACDGRLGATVQDPLVRAED